MEVVCFSHLETCPFKYSLSCALVLGCQASFPTLEFFERGDQGMRVHPTILLSVSTDELIFGDTGRDPAEHLKLHFEAVARLPPEEQSTVLEVIDGLLLKHQALTKKF